VKHTQISAALFAIAQPVAFRVSNVSHLEYRPDIDGLRAVAVMLVVLYHLGLGVNSGFVGVDVFFVISGFLITSKILPQIEASQFSFWSFFKKRLFRLLPAAAVVTVITLVVGWFVMLPEDYASTSKSSIAHLLFSANIFFWKSTDYFQASAETFPLLHTWSLSLEEQFYVICPIVLCVAMKFGYRAVKVVCLLSLLISFYLCLWAVDRFASAHYYLLPTRWWELGLGALIPVLGVQPIRSRVLASGFVVVGILMILISGYMAPKEHFPSWWALLPCLGTLMVIMGGFVENPVSRWLSNRLFVGIGLLSYSLYLWHWPIHSFVSYLSIDPSDYGILQRLIVLFVSVLFAYLSWRFVENKYRGHRGMNKVKRVEFAGGLAVLLTVSVSVAQSEGVPSRLSKEALTILESKQPPHGVVIARKVPDNHKYHYFGNSEQQGGVRVCLWGDSHAAPFFPIVKELAAEESIGGFAALCAATPPLFNYIPKHKDSLRKQAPRYNQQIFEEIVQLDCDIVVIGVRWDLYLREDTYEEIKREFSMVIKALESKGVDYLIFGQPPISRSNSPRALALSDFLGIKLPDLVSYQEHREALQYRLFKELALEPKVVDIVDFMRIGEDELRNSIDGRALYYDQNHLSYWGASLLKSELKKRITAHEGTK